MAYARIAATSALLALVAACGSDAAGPRLGPPAQMEVVSTPPYSAADGGVGTFSVRVRDAAGAAVSGVRVAFAASGGATVSPSESDTDASGIAATYATIPSGAGSPSVSATIPGTALGVAVQVFVIPRSAETVAPSPDGAARTVARFAVDRTR